MKTRIIQGIEFKVGSWQELTGFNGKECVNNESDQSAIAVLLRSQKPINNKRPLTSDVADARMKLSTTGSRSERS